MELVKEKNDWNENVIERGPRSGAFLQSWEWGSIQQSFGCKVLRYKTTDAQAQLVEFKLPFGQKYSYIARGPIGESNFACVDMLKLIKSEVKSAMFLRVDSACELSVNNARVVKDVQPSTTLITNLNHDESELFEKMHQKTRYNIRLAKKKGVEVQIGVDALDVFTALVKETGKRHGIRSHGREHYASILDHLDGTDGKPRAFIALAIHKSDVLASAMCIDWNGTRTYLHGASADNKKNFMAPYLLHWKLMDDAKTHGLHAYDWWGIAPEGVVEHPLKGVTRFKKGFGGEVVKLQGTFDIIQKSVWYWLYETVRRLK